MTKSKYEKPCYKLRYCPYGRAVELFPNSGYVPDDGKILGIKQKKNAERCRRFGHDCPVYYLKELVVETDPII